MRFLDYLHAALPQITLIAVADVLCALVLLIAQVSEALTALVCAIVTTGAVIALVCDFERKRPFYTDLARGIEDVEHPLWITEFIDRPDYPEGAIAYDALRAIAKAANDDVAGFRLQAIDHREYIETWVHETKTPLAAAHLMLENLEGETDLAARAERFADLDEELLRVEGFIEQALFYARSEAVERDYLIRRCRLRELVSTAIKANATSLISSHVTPVCSDLDVEVFTDEKWIGFILGQIIQNSIKYARPQGARILFSGQRVRRDRAGESVVLTIADNGCGVSAADLPRVFDKGFTGQNGRSGRRSTGIGLYLVKRLCDKMGVLIGAQAKEGQGFELSLSFSTNKFHCFDR